MQATVKQVVDFYKKYPHLKGFLKVKTPYGYKAIQEAEETDYSIPVSVVTETKNIICSQNHRFKINEDSIKDDGSFRKIKDMNTGDYIITDNGKEKIIAVHKFIEKRFLYDFQVEDVEQYYTNGIVSHNSCVFIDSLMFGLFGKPVRKINLPDLPNAINGGKGCEVKMRLSVSDKKYMIHRGINPGFLKLYENYNEGDEDIRNNENEIQDSAKKFTQKKIDDLICSNFNTLSHLLIMSNTYSAPFLDLDTKKKREIIEDILGVSIFGCMAEKAKDISLEYKSDLKVTEKDYEVNKSSLSTLENNIEKLKEKSEEFKDNKKNKLDKIKTRLKKNKQDTDELNGKFEDEHELTPKIQELQELDKALNKKSGEYSLDKKAAKLAQRSNLKILDELKDKPVCPVCNTETSSDHIKEHTANLEQEITDAIETQRINKDLYDKNYDKREKIDKKIDELTSRIEESKKAVSKLERLKEEKDRIKADALDIKSEKNNFLELINEDELNEKKELIEELEVKLEEMNSERKYYEYIRKLLSDDGIKNYIIKKVLKFWNVKVNFYLKELNAEFSIYFDEQLNAIIKSRNRDPLQYHSFSGGEKARIDVAILLSVIDISKIQNSIDLNVMVIDELLDGGLDDNGREDVLNLFKKMTYTDKSIYVISHNSNLPLDLFDKEINLIKKNGFTSFK